MAGTLKLTFQTQFVDFPRTDGAITIKFKPAGSAITYDLILNLEQAPVGPTEFEEVVWIDGNSGEDDLQASKYAQAFQRDFFTFGSNPPGTSNLGASASDNEVTLIARSGTFEAGSFYSGNVLIMAFDPPDNTPDEVKPFFTHTRKNTGSCLVVNYDFQVSTGTGPFKLLLNGVEQLTGWDGLATELAISRVGTTKAIVEDSLGVQSNPQNITPPRKLVPGDFNPVQVQTGVAVDLNINTVVPVLHTTPLQYSLDDKDAVTGGNYQSGNVFPGILDGTYKLFIKDVYGCEIEQNLVVSVDQSGEGSAALLRVFLVSEMNSLSFARRDNDLRKYINTLSWEEELALPKQALFHFTAEDDIATQFKSSYPFHVVTLFKCDGTKEELNFNLIQENLGVAEKVDCMLFQLDTDQIAVYFNGGNEYEPGTTIDIGPSPYDKGLPEWAKVGNYASFDGEGSKEIQSVGYDSLRNTMYFVIPGTVAAEQADLVQATFNRHDYNTFRFDFPMSKVSNLAFIRVEAGWAFDEIDQVWQSETIKLLTDTTNFLKIEWEAFKILNDMLFIDNIKSLMWIKGRIRPYAIGEAETYEGELDTYSLEQEARMGMKASFPLMTPKQWHKFNAVSGISVAGTLRINDMILVRLSTIDQQELGDSNYSNVECEFAYSANELSERPSEIVLDISTGVPGSGGTGKEPIVGWTGFERLQLADGTYLRLEDGTFVSL